MNFDEEENVKWKVYIISLVEIYLHFYKFSYFIKEVSQIFFKFLPDQIGVITHLFEQTLSHYDNQE